MRFLDFKLIQSLSFISGENVSQLVLVSIPFPAIVQFDLIVIIIRVCRINAPKTMVTYWESSRRPLFVKTVWRDGQHHVLLENESDANYYQKQDEIKRISTTDSRKSNKRTSKSANVNTNLNVAPIKLLLCGVTQFKNNLKMKRCKTTNVNITENVNHWNIVPGEPIKIQDFNKTIIFNENKEKIYPIVNETASCNEIVCNNLSDRVMIWLDLAHQNGKTVEIPPNEDDDVVQEKTVIKNNNNQYRSHTLDFTERNEHATYNNNDEKFIVDDENGKEIIVLDSKLEENFVGTNNNVKMKNRLSTTKRQLHIFMPNLPKRFSENGSSLLSSSLSSSLR